MGQLLAGPEVAQSLQRYVIQPDLSGIFNLNSVVLNSREAMKTEPLPELILKLAAAACLLPANRRTARYPGSFNTQPATEGVRRLVFVQPLKLSVAQIDAFTTILPNKSCPLQPGAGCVLQLDSRSR
jgi:carbonic anhydrase